MQTSPTTAAPRRWRRAHRQTLTLTVTPAPAAAQRRNLWSLATAHRCGPLGVRAARRSRRQLQKVPWPYPNYDYFRDIVPWLLMTMSAFLYTSVAVAQQVT